MKTIHSRTDGMSMRSSQGGSALLGSEIPFARLKRRPSIAPCLHRLILRISFLLLLAAFPAEILAQTSENGEDGSASSESLADLSLDELLNVKVTSVSRKVEELNDAAAAVFVLNPEDLSRSGATTIPEALRLVPGMNVGRMSASQWAVSSRGFNNQYANKLLVMIDGRTVYAPTFAGVHWDEHDLLLEDLDQIEVIRGPGASLWGANAVNGVINIISKSARETQGGLITIAYGTEDHPSVGIRYGDRIGENLFYRAYVKSFNRKGLVDSTGRNTPDDWDALRGGFRLDWEPNGNDSVSLQSEYFEGKKGEDVQEARLTPPFVSTFSVVNDNSSWFVRGSWTHTISDESNFSVQAYYDHQRHGSGSSQQEWSIYNFDFQHRFALGPRQEITWGAGYRYNKDDLPPTFILTWTPEHRDDHLYSGFIQDEITLSPGRLWLTLGSKFEHNDYTGFEVQPSGRFLWTPGERQTVWASVSRAVRTPSRFEDTGRVNATAFQPSPFSPTFLIAVLPEPELESEELTAYELGVRFEPATNLSFDLAAFYNVYDNLILYTEGETRFETTPPPPHMLIPLNPGNNQSGETYGAEASVHWRVADHWKLTAGYSWLHMRLHPEEDTEGNNPQHQVNLRSTYDLPWDLRFNSAAYYVDNLASQGIPAYIRIDAGLTWSPTESLEFSIWGKNLFDNRHPEFADHSASIQTEVPRSVRGKVTWRF